jgi:hypothetical protein
MNPTLRLTPAKSGTALKEYDSFIIVTGFCPHHRHKKGADLSHPDRGTAKRLLEECSKPRRVARAWAGSPNVKIRGFRSDRSRCYAKLLLFEITSFGFSVASIMHLSAGRCKQFAKSASGGSKRRRDLMMDSLCPGISEGGLCYDCPPCW